MEHRAGPLLANRSLSALIAVSFVLSALAGLYIVASPPQSAAQAPIGDLIVTSGTYTIENIEQPVDGDVEVSGTGTLVIDNGALMVISNVGLLRTIEVGAGGTLTMTHGVITSYLDQIDPWPFLTLTINGGTVIASETSVLRFPGYINIMNGGELILYDSTIEALSAEDLSMYISGSPTVTADSANDGPTITVLDGDLKLFDSAISMLPEYPTDGMDARDLTLSGDSTLLGVNSYISLDFGPAQTIPDEYTHNMLVLGDSSSAYLYGCWFDEYFGTYSQRAPAVYAAGLSTSPATPSVKGGSDNTGQALSSLASVDGLTYEVDAQTTMEIETWDNGTIDGAELVDTASLVATYSVASNYAGSASIEWAPDSGSYSLTDITPDASQVSGSWIYDLPTTILTTVGDLRTMDLRFVNDGTSGTGSVEFDQICIVFTVGADAYIYRWLNVTVGDEYGVPIPDAGIDAVFTGATELEGQEAIYYTPSGVSHTPQSEVLDYMGKTAESVFVTESDGIASIPFLTDIITNGDSNNSVFVGSYEVTGSTEIDTDPYSSSESFSFPAYPAMTSADQQFDVTVEVTGISAESPDLARWLVVPPDLTIEDTSFYHAGDVIVASDGTLTVSNTVFRMVQSYSYERTIYVDGTANFVLEDSTLVSALPINIVVKGDGTLSVIRSNLTGVNVIAMEHATIILDGAVASGMITTSWDSEAHILISDSTVVQAPQLSGSSVCEVTNTSLPSIVVDDDAVALIYRWIHVTVLDGGDYPLEDAVVYVRFLVNNTFWASEVTDSSGVARLKSISSILTSDARTDVGNYIINASYWSDGVEYFCDQNVSVGVLPYSTPLTENATYAVLKLSEVLLPELSVSGDDLWTEPSDVVLNSECTIVVMVWNTGEDSATNATVDFYIGDTVETGDLIGTYNTGTIAVDHMEYASMTWTPTVAGDQTIWVVVNDGPVFDERSMSNNIASLPVEVLGYADLVAGTISFYLQGTLTPLSDIPSGSAITLKSVLTNDGEAPVTVVPVTLTVTHGNETDVEDYTVAADISGGSSMVMSLDYTLPSVLENTDFVFQIAVNPERDIVETTYANNNVSATLHVLDIRPDFKVGVEDIEILYGPSGDVIPVYGSTVTIAAIVHNLGGTNPGNVSIQFGLVGSNFPISIQEESIGADMSKTVTANYRINITDGGTYTFYVFADYANVHDEQDEDNNRAEIDMEIEQLSVAIDVGVESTEYEAGDMMVVTAEIQYSGTNISVPSLRGVWVELWDEEGRRIASSSIQTTTATGEGSFTITIPEDDIPSGTYTVVCMVQGLTDTGEESVEIIGTSTGGAIPLLVWIAVIGAIAAVVIGFTVYTYVYGLGKLVECGQCGEFIPAASKRCPKCGVEFEVGTMKCSECGAWVPAESAECTNCGVKFVGEEVGEEDYLEKMRAEYDEMTSKYRELAKAELGKKFSDKKFEEWWVAQPTYISFDDWLAKEEEKRKEGPIACPVCGTLNPKEATVCNKCGTVFGAGKQTPPGQGPPPSSPPGAGAEIEQPVAREPEQQPPVEPVAQAPPAAPKMVIRRPIDRKVVPKKIIKTPISGSSSEKTENNEDQ